MGFGSIAGKLGLQALGSIGAGDSYVVMGAMTECTWGSMDSRLILPLSHGVYIKGRAQLNIMDFKPIMNILPFGMCSSLLNPLVAAATAANQGVLRKMPCIPVVVTPWMKGKMDKLVENQPALLCSSMNMCLFAGLITINDDGQPL
jgi:hypothetical protein